MRGGQGRKQTVDWWGLASFSGQGFFDPLGRHGKLEYPGTSSIEDGVGNAPTHTDDWRLPTSLGRDFQILNQHSFNPGKPGKAGDLVGIKVAVKDLSAFKMDFLRQ